MLILILLLCMCENLLDAEGISYNLFHEASYAEAWEI